MRAVAAFASLLVAAGCAREDEGALPAACQASPAVFADALGAAPREVRLEGVRLSECLVKDASVGDVHAVGSAFLETAQRLSRKRDAVALGYLVGALRRGAERSQGIHLEIVRRIEQEARPLAGSPAYDRGLRAGRTSG